MRLQCLLDDVGASPPPALHWEAGLVVNVNFPPASAGAVKGVALTHQGSGCVFPAFKEVSEPTGPHLAGGRQASGWLAWCWWLSPHPCVYTQRGCTGAVHARAGHWCLGPCTAQLLTRVVGCCRPPIPVLPSAHPPAEIDEHTPNLRMFRNYAGHARE